MTAAAAQGSREPASPAAASGGSPGSRVGPNAVIQLGHALRAQRGEARAVQVFAAAGLREWLDEPPQVMVDERAVDRLFRSLRGCLAAGEAAAVAAEAGERTAQYLLANRIPPAARAALRLLPQPLSARMLLRAIGANAWTFAGSGVFRARPGPPDRVEILANPIAIPGCVWHVAIFEGLFRALVAPRARVRHLSCCLDGAPGCRFDIDRPRRRQGASRVRSVARSSTQAQGISSISDTLKTPIAFEERA